MTFRVGQKVVCVDAKAPPDEFGCWTGRTLPVEGSVYTIRGWVQNYDSGPGVVLEEIVHGPALRGLEPNFHPRRFRPVVERKTNISVFTDMLDPARSEELCGND